MRNKMIKAAKAWLGCKKADGSHKQIIDTYNTIKPLPAGYKLSYHDAWCAAFVSAVALRCDCTDIVFPECSCDRMIQLYKKAGRWQENDGYTPKVADIIFYDWGDSGSGDNTGSSDHVGIVATVNGDTFTVIEGNMSDKVGYRTMSVNGQYIRGYGLPNYENGGKVVAKSETTTVAGNTVTIKMRQIKKGMTGEDVRALQILLKGRGFSVGSTGADGDFGAGTLAGVKAAQKKYGLSQDGIAGADTLDALLNG